MPITRGSTPADAHPMSRAIGARSSAAALRPDISTSAAPPSVMPDEVPAVMMPGLPSTLPNTGGSFRSCSIVVSGRGCSSAATVASRPF